ncbi:signal recognition particle receptor subunit beta [Actinomadura pelletieri DSM 43383]|uniref:Signal recognition particle receptor subunit beta n=2 Tax=Actinomadura pelletieri TaxID=111805 RepID=A0A495QKE4_9ACTN|nr:signal recognition particle receptor subunit beta [Actinomadura pelletieri DSM 43383]
MSPSTSPSTSPSMPSSLSPARAPSPAPYAPDADVPLHTLKILVAGGFGVGKTTLVGSVSEIRPLRTEEALTDVSVGVDDLGGVERKTTTTVAMDFGRLTFSGGVRLYLFGTPGQERFWFMWDQISYGAVGAIVLVDTRRLTASFASIDFFEQRRIPFVVAANVFDGARRYHAEQIREALDVDPDVPILLCDVRQRESAKGILVALVEHALRSSR